MKRGLATTILLVCVVVLPGQATADDTQSLSIGDVTVNEDAGTATFTVSLSAGPDAASVDVTTSNGSAIAPGDYASTKAEPLTEIPAGGSKPFTVAIANDSLDEADSESFTVTLANPTGAIIGDGSATGTITDNDDPPRVRIGNAGNVVEGAVASFPVTLSAASGRPVQVSYQTIPASSPDFTGTTNGSITIPSGTTGTITVQTTDDKIIEGDEIFTVALNPCNATCSHGNQTQGTATIKDNEAGPKLSVEPASVVEGDAPGTVELGFTVRLSDASGGAVRVTALTSDGSAVAPLDYQQKSQPITFQPGDTTKPFVVVVKGDVLDEDNETITVSLIDPENAEIATPRATGTITDNDHNSKLSISDASADEPSSGTTSLAFTVTLEPASARTVTVGYGTMDGTATTGGDYTPASGTLTFAPFQTSLNVTVEVLGDTINEDNETVLVNLVSEAGAGMFDRQGQGTIIDKNAPPSLSISDTTAREGAGAKFNVELAGNTLRAVTVTFNTTDGTAREPGDYAARRGTLTFAPGEKTKTIEVSVADDTLAEPFETFSVSLGDPVNATITKNRGTATIEASDQAAPASQNPPGPTVKPAATPKVLLPKMVLAPRTVKVTVGGLARLFLTCAKASPITCSGSVTLQTTGKPAVKIGSKTFSVKKGKKQTLGVKLSPKARKLLTQRPTLRARVVVLVKTGKKSLRVVPGVITLKAAPKPKTTARPAP